MSSVFGLVALAFVSSLFFRPLFVSLAFSCWLPGVPAVVRASFSFFGVRSWFPVFVGWLRSLHLFFTFCLSMRGLSLLDFVGLSIFGFYFDRWFSSSWTWLVVLLFPFVGFGGFLGPSVFCCLRSPRLLGAAWFFICPFYCVYFFVVFWVFCGSVECSPFLFVFLLCCPLAARVVLFFSLLFVSFCFGGLSVLRLPALPSPTVLFLGPLAFLMFCVLVTGAPLLSLCGVPPSLSLPAPLCLLVSGSEPLSFFVSPGRPSWLLPLPAWSPVLSGKSLLSSHQSCLIHCLARSTSYHPTYLLGATALL